MRKGELHRFVTLAHLVTVTSRQRVRRDTHIGGKFMHIGHDFVPKTESLTKILKILILQDASEEKRRWGTNGIYAPSTG